MRLLLHCFMALLPWPLRRRLLNGVFGHEIAPSARIGLSIVSVDKLTMAAGARIGHLTLVKGLSRLEMGQNSAIGNLNWISGFPLGHPSHFLQQPGRDPSLRLGDEAAVTNRHFIDCTDRVTIGAYTTFAGFRSQVLSHSIDIFQSRQRAQPVTIGQYCFVGTGCILLAGSSLPDRSVLGAGSLLNKAFVQPNHLYAGSPAQPVKALPQEAAYFQRSAGYVD
ncbi:MAG: hypothetical protein NVS2B4_17090 [Ramlibacter sp.]